AFRRSADRGAVPNGLVKVGPFQIDTTTGDTRREDRPVRLSPMEARFVKMLAQRSGQPVGTRQLTETLWGHDNAEQRQALRVLARKVRCKPEKDPDEPRFLLTEPRLGYRLIEPEYGGLQPARAGLRSGLRRAHHFPEQQHELGTLFRREAGGDARFMALDQGERLPVEALALRSEGEGMRPAVMRHRAALDQAALFQPVERGDDGGAVDAERAAQGDLLEARIGRDDGDDAELARREATGAVLPEPRCDIREKIVEHALLRAAERVAE